MPPPHVLQFRNVAPDRGLVARLHIARAVCRRAERDVLEAARQRPVNPLAVVYLNRLSDLLFILARGAAGGNEPLWKPGGER